MTTASMMSISNWDTSRRGNASRGLVEPGLMPQSKSTLLSLVCKRIAERPTSRNPPKAETLTSPTA